MHKESMFLDLREKFRKHKSYWFRDNEVKKYKEIILKLENLGALKSSGENTGFYLITGTFKEFELSLKSILE